MGKVIKNSKVFYLLLLFLLITIVFQMESSNILKVNALSNEKIIYDFLKNELKMNTAAACGVLANIEKESGFIPNLLERGYSWDTGGGYGICQWTNTPRTSTNGRRTNLVNYCKSINLDYTSLQGQLYFLKYELENNVKKGVYDYLKSVSNNAQGAYNAGYKWCYSFEVPAGYNSGVSVQRGDYARIKYWPKYSGELVIIEPSTINGNFSACGSTYTSIVEALKSIGAESSYSYRVKIAVSNGISGYSGTATQNTQMLNMLKSGELKVPVDSPENNVPNPPQVNDFSYTYFPACNSSYTSFVDALKSIGVDSSYSYRTIIANKNGVAGYSQCH